MIKKSLEKIKTWISGISMPRIKTPRIEMPRIEMNENLATTLASGFYTGYLPSAPGTWGSAAILPFAAILHFLTDIWGLLIASGVLFVLGLLASKIYIEIDGRRDPPEITIDEMAAQCLVLTAASLSFIDYLFAFALFRLFDILKPWPVPLLETRLPPATAVMADDIGAAIYAIFLLWIFKFMEIL